jgi:hypothetical protein
LRLTPVSATLVRLLLLGVRNLAFLVLVPLENLQIGSAIVKCFFMMVRLFLVDLMTFLIIHLDVKGSHFVKNCTHSHI